MQYHEGKIELLHAWYHDILRINLGIRGVFYFFSRINSLHLHRPISRILVNLQPQNLEEQHTHVQTSTSKLAPPTTHVQYLAGYIPLFSPADKTIIALHWYVSSIPFKKLLHCNIGLFQRERLKYPSKQKQANERARSTWQSENLASWVPALEASLRTTPVDSIAPTNDLSQRF